MVVVTERAKRKVLFGVGKMWTRVYDEEEKKKLKRLAPKKKKNEIICYKGEELR